jgi:hypothetical protein
LYAIRATKKEKRESGTKKIFLIEWTFSKIDQNYELTFRC